MEDTRDAIRERLQEAFEPVHVAVEDQSGRHVGHAGASGGGHYAVTLVAQAFEGKSLIEQHRMVNEALGDLFKDKVHALALKTYSPAQWSVARSTR